MLLESEALAVGQLADAYLPCLQRLTHVALSALRMFTSWRCSPRCSRGLQRLGNARVPGCLALRSERSGVPAARDRHALPHCPDVGPDLQAVRVADEVTKATMDTARRAASAARCTEHHTAPRIISRDAR